MRVKEIGYGQQNLEGKYSKSRINTEKRRNPVQTDTELTAKDSTMISSP